MEQSTYAEQLAHLRALAMDGCECILDDDDRAALQAVLTHYDAYAAVTEAARDCASYDDLTEPVEDLTPPDQPECLNAARVVLDEALNAAMALEQADARGIVRA